MKYALQFFTFSLFIFLSSCTENSAKSPQNSNNANEASGASSSIIGKWKWAGSAIDDNKNGIADDTEWKFRNAEVEKQYADINVSLDALNVNFNADFTGYVGKSLNDSTKFTWMLIDNGKRISVHDVQNNENSEYYFGKNGELIGKTIGDVTADFEKKEGLPNRTLITFEMFKKEK